MECYSAIKRNRLLAFPPWQPLKSSSHSSVLPHGCGPQQGPQGDQEVSKPRHSIRRGCLTKHTKFVRDMIREVCCFTPYERRAMAAQGLQGQAGPQVHQEKGGDTHPCQEEEREAEQCPGCHEEGSSQEGVSLPPLCTIKLFQKKKKEQTTDNSLNKSKNHYAE